MASDLKIFAGNSNRALARGIADALDTELGAIEFVQQRKYQSQDL